MIGTLTYWEPYGTHRYSPYLTGNTLRLRYKTQPVNAVWGNSRCLLWEPYGTHRYSTYLTGNTLRLRYKAQPVNAVWSWSSCGRQSVDQYVWVSGLPLGSLTRFYLALLLSFDDYVVLLSMRPLWRENGSVIYCTIASGPCQSNHTWAEVPQNSRPYLNVSSETPPTWKARFPYLYPPGTGWPSYTPGHWVPFLSPLTTLGGTTVEVF
jgi:hypothetical protein